MIGVAGIGTALAENRVVVAADDVGLEARQEPTRDVSPWTLSVDASRAALADAGIEPRELDVVLTVGRMRMEYLTWALSLGVQREMGATRAVGVDVTEHTGGSLLAGLRLLKAKFAAQPKLRTALLVAHHRWSDMVPARSSDRWLWPLSDGAAALVVRRGETQLQPIAHAFTSEGRGSMLIGLEQQVLDEGPNPEGFYGQEWALAKSFMLRDPDRWAADYRERARRCLPRVVAAASGKLSAPDAPVFAGYLYPKVAGDLQAALGSRKLSANNAYGMLGGAELAFSMLAVRRDAALRGKPIVLASAGLPAHFGAMSFQAS